MPEPCAGVIFTDLDATLLDHADYGWQAAKPAMQALAARAIPVCLMTSKTSAEVVAIRRELGNGHPFAVENGGAVAVPGGYFEAARCDAETPVQTETLGAAYADLRTLAVRLRDEHGFRYTGFGDMTSTDVQAVTGLDERSAALARDRRASEPLLWRDSDAALVDFQERVVAAGFTTRTGGRFVHLLGHFHKGDALAWLRARFETAHGPIVAVALGDSGNDADMLAAADIGYWVARPDGSYYGAAQGSIRHARGIGPAGWAAAIDELIANNDV